MAAVPTPTRAVLLAFSALVLAGCAARNGGAADAAGGEGWRPLIDERMTAWRGYRSMELPPGWRVENGVMSKGEAGVRDLVTRDRFGDFELVFEWKLAPGGNAGVFYRGTEEYDYIFWTAPEYQLLDDERHPDGRSPLTSAASAFGLYPAPRGVVKPAGEWNAARIVARGPRVEHWLNGVKVVEYEFGSAEWTRRVKESKFGRWPNYGRSASGHLSIQGDHAGSLELRDMRIRTLR